MNETRLLPAGIGGTQKDIAYHEYECSGCGNTCRNTYFEPHRTDMLTRLLCFTCNYWKDFEDQSVASQMTIIDGHVYAPGDRTEGTFRGMAGRRFDIQYIEPSIYAGKKCTTFDLWSGSSIPDRLRHKFPDTAIFLGGAGKENAGGTTCWTSSETNLNPIFPLPGKLKAH